MKHLETITKDWLQKERDLKQHTPIFFISGSNLHPNHKLHKYYFWIYDENSEFENASEVFFKDEYKLTIKKAMDIMKELEKNDIGFVYANVKYHRLGNKIWNYEKLKNEYPEIIFAPSYEDDTDETHESGHK